MFGAGNTGYLRSPTCPAPGVSAPAQPGGSVCARSPRTRTLRTDRRLSDVTSAEGGGGGGGEGGGWGLFPGWAAPGAGAPRFPSAPRAR